MLGFTDRSPTGPDSIFDPSTWPAWLASWPRSATTPKRQLERTKLMG